MLSTLVAGAGPAGSTLALLLARAGTSVCIYDRSIFPRTKACGEYLSAGSVRLLHEIGVGTQLAAHARPVSGVRLHGHGVHATIDFPQPGWSLPRCVLDQTLLRAAREAGASVVRARVEDCSDRAADASLTVRFPDGSTAAAQSTVIIGADGMHSIVARKCGLVADRAHTGRFALGGHYGGFRKLDGYIDMFVDGDTYVAINPLTDTTANVMLVVGHEELAHNAQRVDAFAEERARALAGDLLARASAESKRIAIGPLSYRARRLRSRHVLLIGDAAAFVDPFTGQGVYLAMRCAQIAAECITSGDLRAYEARARREIAARERAAKRVGAFVHTPVLARAAAPMLRRGAWIFSPLVRRVVGAA